MFRVGDKVICIDDSISLEIREKVLRDYDNWVLKGEQYTVREVLFNDDIVTGILLEELHNFPIPIGLIKKFQEPAFAEWRFRKVQYQPNRVVKEKRQIETIKTSF